MRYYHTIVNNLKRYCVSKDKNKPISYVANWVHLDLNKVFINWLQCFNKRDSTLEEQRGVRISRVAKIFTLYHDCLRST